MLEYVNKFVMEKQELSYDERTVVSTAYKNITGNKRAGKDLIRTSSVMCHWNQRIKQKPRFSNRIY